MTIDQFFEKLPRDGWEIRNGVIRRGLCCPVTAAHEAQFSACGWPDAAEELGLEYPVAQDIVAAADDEDARLRPLRARLLDHCGLTAERQP